MARDEWIDRRLRNWAMWHARMHGGGLGYASEAIFADGAEARDGVQGAVVPCDEIEASITNDAVESLKLGHGHIYQTLRCYYLKGLGIKLTAQAMRRAESTIDGHLRQADRLLSAWFVERDRSRRSAAKPVPTVRLLSNDERAQLLQQLASERADLELRARRRRDGVMGPPRPAAKRSRPVLRLPARGSFTS